MTQPPYPSPQPVYPRDLHVPRPGNGWAVATLVLGIVTLLICWIPFVNLLGIVIGLSGLGTGIAGLVVSRRVQRGAAMTSIGMALCVVGMALALVITVVVSKAVLDDIGDDDVPATSAGLGEWVTSGDLQLRVIDVKPCVERPGLSSAVSCPIDLELRTTGSATIVLGEDDIAAVVDQHYERIALSIAGASDGRYRVEPGKNTRILTYVDGGDDGDVVRAVFLDVQDDVRDGGGVGIATD